MTTLLTINAISAVTGVQLAIYAVIYLAATRRAETRCADKLTEARDWAAFAARQHAENCDERDELWAWSMQLKQREDEMRHRKDDDEDETPAEEPAEAEPSARQQLASRPLPNRTIAIREQADRVIADGGDWSLLSVLRGGHDEQHDDSDLPLFRDTTDALTGLRGAYRVLCDSMPVPGERKCHCGQPLPCPNHGKPATVPPALKLHAIEQIRKAVHAGTGA